MYTKQQKRDILKIWYDSVIPALQVLETIDPIFQFPPDSPFGHIPKALIHYTKLVSNIIQDEHDLLTQILTGGQTQFPKIVYINGECVEIKYYTKLKALLNLLD